MPSPCVLLIDDDETIRELVSAVLGDAGYQVVAVADTASGLNAARTSRPRLILLDSIAHRRDYDLFVAAYRQSAPPHAPIYLFTAASDAEERAHELQLDGVLTKPFDIEALVALAVRHGCGKQLGPEAS